MLDVKPPVGRHSMRYYERRYGEESPSKSERYLSSSSSCFTGARPESDAKIVSNGRTTSPFITKTHLSIAPIFPRFQCFRARQLSESLPVGKYLAKIAVQSKSTKARPRLLYKLCDAPYSSVVCITCLAFPRCAVVISSRGSRITLDNGAVASSRCAFYEFVNISRRLRGYGKELGTKICSTRCSLNDGKILHVGCEW